MNTNDNNTPLGDGSPPTELTVMEAAVWGAFLQEGLNSSPFRFTHCEQWKSGYVELIERLCNYLPLLYQILRQHETQEGIRPGVFEYEVVSVFGEYLGEHLVEHQGLLPSDAKVKDAMNILVRKFFQQYTPKPPG